MAGLFDLHAMLVLQAGWAPLAADVVAFRTLFDGKVANATLAEWHGVLAPGGKASHVPFGMAWKQELGERTQVVVQLNDEPADQAFHGSASPRGVPVQHLRETVTVLVYSPVPELNRALHIALHRTMMLAVETFMHAGYHEINYEGGGDVRPEERMLPDGIYAREQRWSALSYARAPRGSSLVAKDLLVAAWDVTVNGHQGGITPKEL